jgi:hypothetical protein
VERSKFSFFVYTSKQDWPELDGPVSLTTNEMSQMTDSKQVRIRTRRRIADNLPDSPWSFRDIVMETQYESDHRACLYERVRPFGQIYALIAWALKIPFLYTSIASGSQWDAEEIWTASIRMIVQTVNTTLIFLNLSMEMRRRVGVLWIWISRTILLPLHMFHETGIPIFSTELITAQVHKLSNLVRLPCTM